MRKTENWTVTQSEESIAVRLSPAHIKIRYPSHLTDTVLSISYTISLHLFCLPFRVMLPVKYENRTHHGNHLFLYCFHY